MQLATLAQGDHTLGHRPVGEINPQGDQGQSTLLGPTGKSCQLPTMQQQLTHPLGRMIPKGRLPVLVNLAVDQP
jgi:hypothetical protein